MTRPSWPDACLAADGRRLSKVLVRSASNYRSSTEIARALSSVLSEWGLDVMMISPEEVSATEEFHAPILGSAVYMDQWMKPAREPADRSGVAPRRPASLAVPQRSSRRTS